jgi:sigma-B regulation protein RsbU (phosphoserine phosphatase)
VRSAVATWNVALARQASQLGRAVEQAVASGGGIPADPAAQAGWLGAARLRLTGSGITDLRIQRLDDPAAGALLDQDVAADALRHHHPLSGLIRRGDDLLLAVMVPGQSPDALLLAFSDLTGLIEAVHIESGASVGLTDPDGHFLVPPRGPREWVTLLEQTAPNLREHRLLGIGDRVLGVDDLPLLDLAGRHIGFRRLLMDETSQQWSADLERLTQFALLSGLVAAVCLALALWARRLFRGMESALMALQSLAHGDLLVRIEGAGSRDEAGAAARALSIFRERQIEQRSDAGRTLRHRRQRLRYMQAQLVRLPGTFEPSERAAMDAEIPHATAASGGETTRPTEPTGDGEATGDGETTGAGMLDTLAVAFRVMVDRVRQQHASLQQLIAEQDSAVHTEARVRALEQEVSLVGRMQARLVPEALPDEGLVTVRGKLLQGTRFGGDFIDFFWLGDGAGTQKRLALVVGWVDGEGLAAAFLAISARALVRALAPAAASPGACLRRVSDLLAGDNEDGLPLNMTLVVVDLEANLLIAARAGMPSPVASARAGSARIMEVEGSAPLGLRHGTKVADTTLDLPSRTAVVLFSQGVAATEIGGVALGAEGVRELMARAPDLDAGPLTAWLAGQISGAQAVRGGDASLVVLRTLT